MAYHDWRQRGFKNSFTKKKSTSEEVTGIFKVTASTAKEMMREYLAARLFAEGDRDLINRELKKSKARGSKGRGGVLGGQSAAEMYDEALLHQFEQRVAGRAMDEGCALRLASCRQKMKERERRVGGERTPRSTEPGERGDWAETGWRTSYPSIPRTRRGWRKIPIRRRKAGNVVPRPPRRRRLSRTGCGGGEDGYGGDAEGGDTDDDGEDGEDGDDDGNCKDEDEDEYDGSNGCGETGKGKRTGSRGV